MIGVHYFMSEIDHKKIPFEKEKFKNMELISTSEDLEQKLREFQAKADNTTKIEETLRRSEYEKAIILDSIPELVTYQNLDLKLIWANRAASESLNLETKDLLGHYCYDLWHNRTEPCENCPVKKAIETGKPQEAEIVTPDKRYWLIRGYPVRDKNGEIDGAVEITL